MKNEIITQDYLEETVRRILSGLGIYWSFSEFKNFINAVIEQMQEAPFTREELEDIIKFTIND